jgi:hypothetical protein
VGLIRVESPVEVLMPDGTKVWVRVSGDLADDRSAAGGSQVDEFGGEAGVDVARRPGEAKNGVAPARLENFVETVRSVANSVHEAVVDAAPSAVSVEFGLELSVQTSHIVAVLAQVGATTSVTVRLDWDRSALREANKAAEPVEPAKPAEPK